MKSTIIKMGVAHSLPRHERIGLSEPVRERNVTRRVTEKKSVTRPVKRKVMRKKTIKTRRKTSPVKKKKK